MFLYGRIFITFCGFMLDEVKSLLHKALRRKEKKFALEATKELTEHKDQLTWKTLLIFLFEDHCLSGSDILSRFLQFYVQNNKRGCVELLLEDCKTCRVAACLPVITLTDEYLEFDFEKKSAEEAGEFDGLLEAKEGCLDFDLIISHLRGAWISRDIKKILICMKLITASHDLEKRTLSEKGNRFLKEKKRGKKTVGQIVLKILHSITNDLNLKIYIGYCYKLACIPESPVRLILFSIGAHLLYPDAVKSKAFIHLGKKVDWRLIGKLNVMPNWVVDKHTHRGKTGKASEPLLAERPKGMTDADMKEFHGPRRKRDIEDFFSDGTEHVDKAIPVNPFWEKTKDIYRRYPRRQQKTIHMTAQYIKFLKKAKPTLFQPETVGIKRKLSNDLVVLNAKKPKIKSTRKRKLSGEELEIDIKRFAPPPGSPLLQVPTGHHKTYALADIAGGKVWKGPFSKKRIERILLVHELMKCVFADKHTLEVEERYPYLVYPLLKGKDAPLRIEKKIYFDHIQKQSVERDFLSRSSMGLRQLHVMSLTQIANLPQSVWAHFFYRFVLGVGDSGLYNALTDPTCSFVYGIDMDEVRGKKPTLEMDILDMMFVKKPARDLQLAILSSMKKNKRELMNELCSVNLDQLTEKYSACFSLKDIREKIDLIKVRVSSL